MIKHIITLGLTPYSDGTGAWNLKAGVYNLLLDLGITAAVYDGQLPQNPTYPTTVYDLIDEVPLGRSHDSEVSPFRDTRIQIDVFAESAKQADDLIEQYFQALNSFDGSIGNGQSPESFKDICIRYENTNPRLDFTAQPTLKNIKGRSMDFKILYK